jgi:uncharacterized membrane protein YbhN (UPF0104 family)
MTQIIGKRIIQAVASAPFRLATRLAVGLGVLIAVIVHVGTGPLLHGLLSLDVRTIGAALLLGAIATAAATWRWRLIASRLGVRLRFSTAAGMYYRSQFLNTVIPGGIVGDVQRAVSAGLDTAGPGSEGKGTDGIRQSARSVAIERSAGQLVQVTIALAVFAWFGAAFEGYLLAVLAIGIGAVCIALVATCAASTRARSAIVRETRELRAVLGSVKTSVQVMIASVIVIACHVATFTIATAAVGVGVPPLQMLTLAFVVLLGASIPLNIGGWGPREGVAGWAFALAGFGAAAGVSASTLFGALVIISVAPGALVVLISAIRRHKAIPATHEPDLRSGPIESSMMPREPAANLLVLTTAHQQETP